MDLIKQLQGISYSLVFGFLFTFVYSFINSLFYKYHKSIFRYILQLVIGVAFGCCYYFGLLMINNGVIRFYFIISLLAGYVLYLNYYNYYLIVVIEAVIKGLKYILSPIIFIFRKINAIIGHMKKVIRWLKKEK
ncbi:spore cortex biosynthesis protein YabQ [uncultured Thomasclavelia sp.]|uniref:spore cortex biosynthesis protein YabQ n=1 Tax=uncultured Thomasclavelia sp. TaxID=3025759 RepID=UPI0035A6019C